MNTALQFFLADDFVQKSLDGLGRRSGRGRPFGCPSSPGRPASPRGATRSNYSIRPGWPALVRESAGPKPKHRHKFEADDASESWVTRLGDKIASLAARINIAEAEMMTLIAEFDRRRGWEAEGFRSCAHWLAWRIGIKLGPARERVRTARALEKLPKTAEALGNGVLSYSKARSLTRVATAESEAQLLELAQAASAAKVEETVKVWRQLCRDGEVTAEQARHRSRKLSVFVDQDGMYVVAGRLEPEAGAVFKRALEAAAFALYKADGGEAGGTEPRQRRADAAGLMAERALEAGLGGRGGRKATMCPTMPKRPRPSPVRARRWMPGRTSGQTPGPAGPAHVPKPGPALAPSTAKWSFTPRWRRCARTASPDARTWTAFAFPRKRPGGSPAMPRWCR